MVCPPLENFHRGQRPIFPLITTIYSIISLVLPNYNLVLNFSKSKVINLFVHKLKIVNLFIHESKSRKLSLLDQSHIQIISSMIFSAP